MRNVILLTAILMFDLSVLAEDAVPGPCDGPAYRQFDFWLGEWTSVSANGATQGTNHIKAILGGCALQENWTSAAGNFQGTSYNFYDASRDAWHQTWIDSSGSSLNLNGKLIDGSMVLHGTRASTSQEPVQDRITFTPMADGRVRQHWESSADAGKSWTDVFDGYYQRGQ